VAGVGGGGGGDDDDDDDDDDGRMHCIRYAMILDVWSRMLSWGGWRGKEKGRSVTKKKNHH
jgi:hypothetical protein